MLGKLLWNSHCVVNIAWHATPLTTWRTKRSKIWIFLFILFLIYLCLTSSLIKKEKRTGVKTEQWKILTWPHKNKGNKISRISWMRHFPVNSFLTKPFNWSALKLWRAVVLQEVLSKKNVFFAWISFYFMKNDKILPEILFFFLIFVRTHPKLCKGLGMAEFQGKYARRSKNLQEVTGRTSSPAWNLWNLLHIAPLRRPLSGDLTVQNLNDDIASM